MAPLQSITGNTCANLCHDKQNEGRGTAGSVRGGTAGKRVIKQLITYSYILETGLAFLGPLGLV